MSKRHLITRNALAELIDVTPQRVSQLAGMKILECIENQYDLKPSIIAYIRFLKARAVSKRLDVAKTRHMEARADLAEMDRSVRQGEYILTSEAQAGWVAVLHRIKGRLRSIPRKLAQQVVMINDPARAEAALRAEIDQALEDCARKELVPKSEPVANPSDKADD